MPHNQPAEPAYADSARKVINTLITKLRTSSALVESENDPKVRGRTAYRISASSRSAVQREITKLQNMVAEKGGRARFIGPALIDNGYGAIGEVILDQTEAA